MYVVVVVVVNFSHFRFIIQNERTNFIQTWHKHPWVNGIQVCSNEGLCRFPRGAYYTLPKMQIISSRTTKQISTKRTCSTNHPLEKKIQVYSNKGSSSFPTRYDNETANKILTIVFSRTIGPISTKLVTKHSWVKMTCALHIKNQ